MIRFDYKDGPRCSAEQTRWEQVNFGSPDLRRIFQSPKKIRRFVQLGLNVRTAGAIASNGDVEFLMFFDRKRQVFFGRQPGDMRPNETLAIVAKGFVWPDGTVSVRADVPGASWFDFSGRPYSRHQQAAQIRPGRTCILPEDAPYNGRLYVHITADGKNCDICNDSHVIFRMHAENVLPRQISNLDPSVKITGVEPEQLAPGVEIAFDWPDREAVLITSTKRVPLFKALWENGKPLFVGPRERSTLDLFYPQNQRLMRTFCDVAEHANAVALNRSQFTGLVTPEDWAPTPYIGFRSKSDLAQALGANSFQISEDLVRDMGDFVREAGMFGVNLPEIAGTVEYVVPAADKGFFVIGYSNHTVKRVPGDIDEPVFLRNGTQPPIMLDNPTKLKGTRLQSSAELFYSASAESFASVETFMETFPDCWRQIATSFIERKRELVGSCIAVPAAYVRSVVSLAARDNNGQPALFWKMAGNGNNDAGLRKAPPVFVDTENPAPFFLKGVEFFPGLPSQYRKIKGSGFFKDEPAAPGYPAKKKRVGYTTPNSVEAPEEASAE